jgi:hypothetical protein
MALASASEEAPPRYTSVTSRLRRKRREVTIGSPPKTTTNMRSTISASTTRVVVATQRAHHLSEARPNLASWSSPVKLLKIRHNPERMTINRDTLPPPRSDVLWTCTCREPIWLRNRAFAPCEPLYLFEALGACRLCLITRARKSRRGREPTPRRRRAPSAEPMVRIHLPPAASQGRTRLRGSAAVATCEGPSSCNPAHRARSGPVQSRDRALYRLMRTIEDAAPILAVAARAAPVGDDAEIEATMTDLGAKNMAGCWFCRTSSTANMRAPSSASPPGTDCPRSSPSPPSPRPAG